VIAGGVAMAYASVYLIPGVILLTKGIKRLNNAVEMHNGSNNLSHGQIKLELGPTSQGIGLSLKF
jgi:hypothetical protein